MRATCTLGPEVDEARLVGMQREPNPPNRSPSSSISLQRAFDNLDTKVSEWIKNKWQSEKLDTTALRAVTRALLEYCVNNRNFALCYNGFMDESKRIPPQLH
jgi:hypothetical protein